MWGDDDDGRERRGARAHAQPCRDVVVFARLRLLCALASTPSKIACVLSEVEI